MIKVIYTYNVCIFGYNYYFVLVVTSAECMFLKKTSIKITLIVMIINYDHYYNYNNTFLGNWNSSANIIICCLFYEMVNSMEWTFWTM